MRNHCSMLPVAGAYLLFALASFAAEVIPGRYIVVLADAPAAEDQATVLRRGVSPREASKSPSVVARRSAIAAQQARYAAVVRARGGRVRTGYDTVLNGFVIDGDERLVNELRRMPGVVRIIPDRVFRKKMDRAVQLGGLNAVLERLGGVSKAGEGVGIAILDSGIDSTHPLLTDETLPAPREPLFNGANRQYITSKVVVVRSYEELASGDGYGADGSDVNGHGTQAACAAACLPGTTALGTIMGFAPKATLGSYKVLGDDGSGPESMILKGLDDAIKDGFVIINMSLGSEVTADPADDVQARAVNEAAKVAVVAVAAGNEGFENGGLNENSINSPGHAEGALTVGSSSNDRSIDGSTGAMAPLDPGMISDFSSKGPSRSRALKPDMVSVGDNLLIAESSLKESADGPIGLTQGTSFSTPSVAGAVATLMAARPEIPTPLMKSLVVNSATVLRGRDGLLAPVRYQGSGRLNVAAALDLPVVVNPVSVNFGIGGTTADVSRELTVTNVTDRPVNLQLQRDDYDGRTAPTLATDFPSRLGPGQSARFTVRFSGSGLSGEYQGALLVTNETNNAAARVPYWYGVDSKRPAGFTFFKPPQSAKSGAEILLLGRVVDASGIDIQDAEFRVEPTAGGGSVVGIEWLGRERPGIFGVILKAGARGENRFTFRAGNASRVFTVRVE